MHSLTLLANCIQSLCYIELYDLRFFRPSSPFELLEVASSVFFFKLWIQVIDPYLISRKYSNSVLNPCNINFSVFRLLYPPS